MWTAKLTEYVNKTTKPVVLVPHSAGTSLVKKWSFDQPATAKLGVWPAGLVFFGQFLATLRA